LFFPEKKKKKKKSCLIEGIVTTELFPSRRQEEDRIGESRPSEDEPCFFKIKYAPSQTITRQYSASSSKQMFSLLL
jgi:hypothetical protein